MIVNCYRLPDNKSIESRNWAIDKIIENIKSINNYQNKYFALVGDLNLSVEMNDDCQETNAIHTKDYIDKLCNELNLHNLIDKSTCFRGNSKSTIDLILTNISNIPCRSILDYGHYDHRPVMISKRRSHDEKTTEKIQVRNMKLLDEEKLNDIVLKTNWNVLRNNDINIYWLNLKSKLVEICDSVCPFKTIKIRSSLPPWYHSDLAILRSERDRLGKRYRKDRFNENKKMILGQSLMN